MSTSISLIVSMSLYSVVVRPSFTIDDHNSFDDDYDDVMFGRPCGCGGG